MRPSAAGRVRLVQVCAALELSEVERGAGGRRAAPRYFGAQVRHVRDAAQCSLHLCVPADGPSTCVTDRGAWRLGA